MRLVANKKVKYGKKTYAAGDRFDATDRDAQVLIATRLAYQDLEPVAAPVVVAEPVAVPRKRNRYQTREMRAS